MATITKLAQRVIFQCKRCKKVRKDQKHVWAHEYTEYLDRGKISFGRYEDGKYITFMTDNFCPTCKRMEWTESTCVHGTYIADKPCNGRCLNATGGNCDCQCGGENHGRNHL